MYGSARTPAQALRQLGSTLSCLVMTLTLSAASQVPPENIHDILDRYCLNCHDADSMKGGVDLDFDPDGNNPISQEPLIWKRVIEVLDMGAMPPPDKKQVPKAQLKELQTWIKNGIKAEIDRTRGDPGHVPMRRLAKAEVKNIVKDITGLNDLSSLNDLPPDPIAGEGFSNVASVLQPGVDHLDSFLNMAHAIADRAAYYHGRGLIFHADPTTEDSTRTMRNRLETDANRLMDHAIQAGLVPKKDLNRLAYAQACWRYRESPSLQQAGLAELARQLKLDADYLSNWWQLIGQAPEQVSDHAIKQAMHDRWQRIPGAPAKQVVTAKSPLPADVAKELQRFVTDLSFVAKRYRHQHARIGIRNGSRTEVRSLKLGAKPPSHFYVVTRGLGENNKRTTIITRDLQYVVSSIDPKTKKRVSKRHDYLGWLKHTYLKQNQGSEDSAALQQVVARMKGHKLPLQLQEAIRLPVPPGAKEIRFNCTVSVGKTADIFVVQTTVMDYDPGDAIYIFGPLVHVRWDNIQMERPPLVRKWSRAHGYPRQLFPESAEQRVRYFQGIWKSVLSDKARSTEVLNFKQASKRMPPGLADQLRQLHQDWIGLQYRIAVRQEMQLLEKHNLKSGEQVPSEDLKGRLASLKEKQTKFKAILSDRTQGLQQNLIQFAERAWGRHLSKAEQQHIRNSISDHDIANDDPHHDLRQAIAKILSSPHFLLRRLPGASSQERLAPLTSLALSQRLAAMLWVTNPDQALRRAAAENSLQNAETMRAETKRMLQSAKISGLIQEFFGNWFDFKDFRHFGTVDTTRFPEFTDAIKLLMEQEITRFCTDLVRQDKPITDLITSTKTILNKQLAEYYGVNAKKVRGHGMQEVDVQRFQRGGLLGMGFFHAKTSYALRTSPVLRGDYVLTRILGRHTPPPPPGVPPLPEDDAKTDKSMAEHLRIHRENPRCAACHDHIDPLGIPLENFSPSGRLRKKDGGGQPLELQAEIHGHSITGQAGLRAYIIKHQDEFVRLFCRKFIAYGLGRPLHIGDKPLIDEMVKTLQENQYRFSAAVHCLVASKQFRFRRTS